VDWALGSVVGCRTIVSGASLGVVAGTVVITVEAAPDVGTVVSGAGVVVLVELAGPTVVEVETELVVELVVEPGSIVVVVLVEVVVLLVVVLLVVVLLVLVGSVVVGSVVVELDVEVDVELAGEVVVVEEVEEVSGSVVVVEDVVVDDVVVDDVVVDDVVGDVEVVVAAAGVMNDRIAPT
jgi:hypothetical protein